MVILNLEWIEKKWRLEVLDNREKITLYYNDDYDMWTKDQPTKDQPKQIYFGRFSFGINLTLLIDGIQKKYYYNEEKKEFYPWS